MRNQKKVLSKYSKLVESEYCEYNSKMRADESFAVQRTGLKPSPWNTVMGEEKKEREKNERTKAPYPQTPLKSNPTGVFADRLDLLAAAAGFRVEVGDEGSTWWTPCCYNMHDSRAVRSWCGSKPGTDLEKGPKGR